jgi:hypothetical protein
MKTVITIMAKITSKNITRYKEAHFIIMIKMSIHLEDTKEHQNA